MKVEPHTHIHTYTCTQTDRHTQTHTYTYTCTYTYTHTHIHTHIHIHTHTLYIIYENIHIYICISDTCRYIYIRVVLYIDIYLLVQLHLAPDKGLLLLLERSFLCARLRSHSLLLAGKLSP